MPFSWAVERSVLLPSVFALTALAFVAGGSAVVSPRASSAADRDALGEEPVQPCRPTPGPANKGPDAVPRVRTQSDSGPDGNAAAQGRAGPPRQSPAVGAGQKPGPGELDYRVVPIRRTRTGVYVVRAWIDGVEATMIIDTASVETVVDARRLEVIRRGRGAPPMPWNPSGPPERPPVPFTNLYSLGFWADLRVGSVLVVHGMITNYDLSRVNHFLTLNGDEPADGLLGADILSTHQGVIDFRVPCLRLVPPDWRAWLTRPRAAPRRPERPPLNALREVGRRPCGVRPT